MQEKDIVISVVSSKTKQNKPKTHRHKIKPRSPQLPAILICVGPKSIEMNVCVPQWQCVPNCDKQYSRNSSSAFGEVFRLVLCCFFFFFPPHRKNELEEQVSKILCKKIVNWEVYTFSQESWNEYKVIITLQIEKVLMPNLNQGSSLFPLHSLSLLEET